MGAIIDIIFIGFIVLAVIGIIFRISDWIRENFIYPFKYDISPAPSAVNEEPITYDQTNNGNLAENFFMHHC